MPYIACDGYREGYEHLFTKYCRDCGMLKSMCECSPKTSKTQGDQDG